MKKDKFGATIIRERISEEFAKLWEIYPEFRGKSQNKLVNLAWDEWVRQKLKEDEKSNPGIPALLNWGCDSLAFSQPISDTFIS